MATTDLASTPSVSDFYEGKGGSFAHVRAPETAKVR